MNRFAEVPLVRSRSCASKLASTTVAVLAAALFSSCASYSGAHLVAGKSTAAEVESSMGTPAEKLAEAGESVWFYTRGPAGRQTFAIRIGGDGIVRSIEQRLTMANVAKLVVDKTAAKEARALLGPPYLISYWPRLKHHFWEYKILDGENQTGENSFKALTLEFSDDEVLRRTTMQDDFYDPEGGCFLC